MAQLLNVNRKTVILAYEEAETKGWLQSVQRRGTFVSQQLAPGTAAVCGAVRPFALALPEEPVVLTRSAVREETVAVLVGERLRAGPSETSAFAIRAINSLRLHAGSTERTSRCDLCSIARVGYRPYSTMEES